MDIKWIQEKLKNTTVRCKFPQQIAELTDSGNWVISGAPDLTATEINTYFYLALETQEDKTKFAMDCFHYDEAIIVQLFEFHPGKTVHPKTRQLCTCIDCGPMTEERKAKNKEYNEQFKKNRGEIK